MPTDDIQVRIKTLCSGPVLKRTAPVGDLALVQRGQYLWMDGRIRRMGIATPRPVQADLAEIALAIGPNNNFTRTKGGFAANQPDAAKLAGGCAPVRSSQHIGVDMEG